MPYSGDVTVGGDADVRTAGALQVTKVATPPFENNCYLLRCTATGDTLLVDAAGDAPLLLSLVGDGRLVGVLETHGHWDHVQALAEVQDASGAPVLVHAGDAEMLPVPPTGSSRTARPSPSASAPSPSSTSRATRPAASPCSGRATPSGRTCGAATACSPAAPATPRRTPSASAG